MKLLWLYLGIQKATSAIVSVALKLLLVNGPFVTGFAR